jgi:hypothetical protein
MVGRIEYIKGGGTVVINRRKIRTIRGRGNIETIPTMGVL